MKKWLVAGLAWSLVSMVLTLDFGRSMGRKEERATMLHGLQNERVMYIFYSDGVGQSASRRAHLSRSGDVEWEDMNNPGVLP